MKTEEAVKPPVWFWVVSALALVWNLLGVMAYLGQAFMTDEAMAALPEAQRALYEELPAWYTAAFAIAVWAGALGCIGLLLRKKWAHPVFLISLLGILAQQTYLFFLSDTLEVMGNEAAYMPISIIIVGIALLFFARLGINRNWLT